MDQGAQSIDRLQEYAEVVYKDDLYLRDLVKELKNTIFGTY